MTSCPASARALTDPGYFSAQSPTTKKRRLRLISVQDIDERLRVLVAPGGVEGQRYALVVALYAVDRQLAAGGRRLQEGRRACREHDHQRGSASAARRTVCLFSFRLRFIG